MSIAFAPPIVEPSENPLPGMHDAEVALERARARRGKTLLALAVFGVLEAAAGVAVARATTKRRNRAWYRFLAQPPTTTHNRAFRIAWPVLYGLSAASAALVWRTPRSPARTVALVAWAGRLLTNAAWTPISRALGRIRSGSRAA